MDKESVFKVLGFTAAVAGATAAFATPFLLHDKNLSSVGDYNELVQTLCDEAAELSGQKFSNAKFRLMSGTRNEPIIICATANNEQGTLCLIKFTITDPKNKIYNSNAREVKYKIIKNLDRLNIVIDVTPANEKIIRIMNKLSELPTVLTTPTDKSWGNITDSCVGGYFFDKTDDGFMCNIVSSAETIAPDSGGLHFGEQTIDYGYIKNVSFPIPEDVVMSYDALNGYMEDFLERIIMQDENNFKIEIEYDKIREKTDTSPKKDSASVPAPAM